MSNLNLQVNTGTDQEPQFTPVGSLLTMHRQNFNFSVNPVVQGQVAFTYTNLDGTRTPDAGQKALEALFAANTTGTFVARTPKNPDIRFSGQIASLTTSAGVTSGVINIASNVKFSLGSNVTTTVIHV